MITPAFRESKTPMQTKSLVGKVLTSFHGPTIRNFTGSHALGGKGFGEPLEFDNVYYKTLLEKPWESSDSMKQMIGIPSDRVLPGKLCVC